MKDTPDGFLSYYLPFRKLKAIRFFDSLGGLQFEGHYIYIRCSVISAKDWKN